MNALTVPLLLRSFATTTSRCNTVTDRVCYAIRGGKSEGGKEERKRVRDVCNIYILRRTAFRVDSAMPINRVAGKSSKLLTSAAMRLPLPFFIVGYILYVRKFLETRVFLPLSPTTSHPPMPLRIHHFPPSHLDIASTAAARVPVRLTPPRPASSSGSSCEHNGARIHLGQPYRPPAHPLSPLPFFFFVSRWNSVEE